MEAWHWNPEGMWSDPAGKGYFTGWVDSTKFIRYSFGYALPHRGVTRNDGTGNTGYSRLTDGDESTYWKGNPYLASRFTGEDDALHAQWVILDLANDALVDTLKIAWAEPYAKQYLVQHWNGTDPIHAFVETIEYSRFVEFCDVCRHFRYIGLCYGPPGIEKTLSSIKYSLAEKIIAHDRWTSETTYDLPVDTLLYTTSVINTPSRISQDINMAREKVMSIVLDPIRHEGSADLDLIRIRDEKRRKELFPKPVPYMV